MPVDVPVHEIKGPNDSFFRVNISPWMFKDMIRIIKNGNFDVIHPHHAFAKMPFSAFNIARKLGIRSILTIQNDDLKD